MPIDDLLAKARTLGQALAAEPCVQDYYAAQRAARQDQAAQKLLQDYQTHATHLRQLEREQKPVEVADKQRLRDFEQQMAGNESLKRLMRSQADYVDLMNRVNSEMDAPLAALHEPEKPA
jgi:cell fate (sporulation/competence/biofilm development) regulator YlbF (YheA/YmcA/DUF963 family)